jgi:hypothetical protein
MYRTLLYLLTASLISVAACKKEPPPQGTTTNDVERYYWVINNTDSRLFFNVYRTEHDYKYSTYPIIQKVAEPGDSIRVDVPVFEKYYIDWFTENDVYSNWSLRFSNLTFDYELMADNITTGGFQRIYAIVGTTGYARSAFIRNNAELKLKAIDLVDFNRKSFWNSVPLPERHVRLTINKAMGFAVERVRGTDTMKSDGYYLVAKTNNGGHQLSLVQDASQTSYGLHTMAPFVKKPSADTFYMSDTDIGAYYVMVRE